MEFDLISRYFEPLCQGIAQGDLGIGDDGALLSIPKNNHLVVVTDTLVSGVHFPGDTAAYDIAWKALAVNLSDLAAMGATPIGYSLGLSLPKRYATSEKWMQDFSQGFADLVTSTGMEIPLVGGDTTRSEILTITVSAKGIVPKGQALLRSGAKPGDSIVVSGILGEGALGLQLAMNWLNSELEGSLSNEQIQQAEAYLNRPTPQLKLGRALYPLANSAIDISDGLLQDVGHILKRSSSSDHQLGAKIDLEKLPLSFAMQSLCQQDSAFWKWPLSGGDDYQLCITVPKENLDGLKKVEQETNVELSVIGEITETGKVELSLNGQDFSLPDIKGFQHF